jgi:hypothetical protein
MVGTRHNVCQQTDRRSRAINRRIYTEIYVDSTHHFVSRLVTSLVSALAMLVIDKYFKRVEVIVLLT